MVTISKVTALQRLEIDGEPKFYAFTDKFLSEKEEISEENFWDLRPHFPVGGYKNKPLDCIYFISGFQEVKERIKTIC